VIELLYAALASPNGIIVETSSVERLRQKLYTARRELNDEALEALSLVPSPTNECELWIVRRPQREA